jgi:formylglycine-generating enzyme required for sulfatase activity
VAKPGPHVFLSHVRDDAERVERLAAALEARSIETWLDRHQIKPGQRWQKAIEDAIRSGAFFVACFSQAYAERTRSYMNEELLLAIEEVRLRPEEATWFIPIRLDDCEIPDRRIGPELNIRSFQWLDMFPDWERSVERLAEAIKPSSTPDHLLETFAVFRDIDALWCPELVAIPPGNFMMGSPENEDGRNDNEGPQHEVTFAEHFAVGRYPVTFEEYDRFAEAAWRQLPRDEGWGRGRRPTINVFWDDANAYVRWLSEETGQPFHLLSEAEWEYVCRAGTTTRYWWGDSDPTSEQANFGRNVGKTTEVGAYLPNPWGLYDMHGNVWEWVEDCWHDSYEGAPLHGSAWKSGAGGSRIVRGGSWSGVPEDLRSAGRGRSKSGGRDLSVGFRVARKLSRSEC